ncbi:ABC transporter permease [Pseudoalteromonas tunicata]|jgi:predicted permease|uniref:Putative permease n=2 Tax=Pseudoalteromonas tunicata TaxID=314281 RepID=A4C4T6_9GAMM|nr:ABC transporter permease [Pseudoalteromonas tunicata]AXT33079.1 hypothetical protein D1819_19865 [Pseudoalteromonas tunicata]EAR30568.1 putative permease [Pseudoalteromonas tunicata D2]MDP5213924.1 ABC transporter permease [Pseudoalteromonas tunicata]
MMGLLLDIRYALRLLAKSPKFTLLVSFILVGSLSISLLAFNYVNTITAKAINIPDGETVTTLKIKGGQPGAGLWMADFQNLIAETEFSQLVQEFATSRSMDAWYSSPTAKGSQSLNGFAVGSQFFDFARSAPVLGRYIHAQDLEKGASDVVVLSYKTWQTVFGGDPAVIGQTITLNKMPHEVIGVAPLGFRFPSWAQVWLADKSLSQQVQKETLRTDLYLRLKPTVTGVQYETFVAAFLNERFSRRLSEIDREQFSEITAALISLPEQNTDGMAWLMHFMNLVALMILSMACINTGNLLLARAMERRKETAIRAALGARQWRIFRQLVCEGTLIILIGSVLATLLAGFLIDFVNTMMHSAFGDKLPFWWQWQMDAQTLCAGLFFLVFTLVFACILPALKATRLDLNDVLRDGTRGALGKKAARNGRILVMMQIGLITTLMLVGGLTTHIITNTKEIVNELALDNLYRSQFSLAEFYHNDHDKIRSVLAATVQKTQADPSWLLFQLRQRLGNVKIQVDAKEEQVDVSFISGQMDNLGYPIIKGRDIALNDDQSSQQVAVVSQSFAKQYFIDEDAALGQFIEVGDEFAKRYQIIGVVTNKGQNSQGLFAPADQFHEVYLSFWQLSNEQLETVFDTLFVNKAELTAAIDAFYDLLYQIDPQLPLPEVFDYNENSNVALRSLTKISEVILAVGSFALVLALIGIYGMTANQVSLGCHEIGLRRAIGAKDTAIIRLFMSKNAKPVFWGMGSALVIYIALSWVINTISNDLIDGSMFIMAGLVTSITLLSVIALAVYLPCKKAVMQEPAQSLRVD